MSSTTNKRIRDLAEHAWTLSHNDMVEAVAILREITGLSFDMAFMAIDAAAVIDEAQAAGMRRSNYGRGAMNRRANICPACRRPFPPRLAVHGPVRQAIVNTIANRPDGITRAELLDVVYREDIDGGPDNPNTIAVLVKTREHGIGSAGLSHRIHLARPGCPLPLDQNRTEFAAGNNRRHPARLSQRATENDRQQIDDLHEEQPNSRVSANSAPDANSGNSK